MLRKFLLIGSIVATIILVLLLNQTTPTQAGPLGVLAFFVLSYFIMVTATTFLLYAVSRFVAKVSHAATVKRPIRALSFAKSYYYASILALGPAMLLGMQSVGSVGFYDVLLVMAFVGIGCVYIGRKIA